tara:strand:- start:6621 stop:7157 length:537 start_codon:yes stop_codon:yes gene_type:complete
MVNRSLTYYIVVAKNDSSEAGNGAAGPKNGRYPRETKAMLECLILGDSLAQGAAAALKAAWQSRCEVVATQGIGSAAIRRSVPPQSYYSATISAGSNDPTNPHLTENLIAIRRSISAKRVVWIAPYNRSVAYVVADLARSYGDYLVDVAETPPVRDGLHPRSYSRLARLLAEGGFGGR